VPSEAALALVALSRYGEFPEQIVNMPK
jgi:hypothetical protein